MDDLAVWMMGTVEAEQRWTDHLEASSLGSPSPPPAEAGAGGLVVQVGSGQALASCRVGRGARLVLACGLMARVHRVWAVLEWGAAVLAWVPAQPRLLVRSLPSRGLGGGGRWGDEAGRAGWRVGVPGVPAEQQSVTAWATGGAAVGTVACLSSSTSRFRDPLEEPGMAPPSL